LFIGIRSKHTRTGIVVACTESQQVVPIKQNGIN